MLKIKEISDTGHEVYDGPQIVATLVVVAGKRVARTLDHRLVCFSANLSKDRFKWFLDQIEYFFSKVTPG